MRSTTKDTVLTLNLAKLVDVGMGECMDGIRRQSFRGSHASHAPMPSCHVRRCRLEPFHSNFSLEDLPAPIFSLLPR